MDAALYHSQIPEGFFMGMQGMTPWFPLFDGRAVHTLGFAMRHRRDQPAYRGTLGETNYCRQRKQNEQMSRRTVTGEQVQEICFQNRTPITSAMGWDTSPPSRLKGSQFRRCQCLTG